MKIILIGPGNSIHIERWVDAIKNHGHDVVLITDKKNTIKKIRVYRLLNPDNRKIPFYWYIVTRSNMFLVNAIVALERPDFVHLHYISQYLTYKLKFKNFFSNAWGSDIFRLEKGTFGYECAKKNILNSKFIFTTTLEMKELILKEFCIKKDNIIPFSWGINTTFFNIKINREELRKERSFDPSDLVFFSPRGINTPYQPELIISSFNAIKEDHKQIKLIILAGSTTEERCKEIKNIIKKNPSRITFIQTLINPMEMADLYNISDIYIGIPVTDQLSSALLEAMACGCYPIVSDLKPYKELIINNENGLILKENTIDNLSYLMRKVINNGPIGKEIIMNNRKIIEKEHDWNCQSKIILNMYDQKNE